MDFKKKCINFKKNAKEFGYELKLTHVQELIAKYEGFENRHAILKNTKKQSNSQHEIDLLIKSLKNIRQSSLPKTQEYIDGILNTYDNNENEKEYEDKGFFYEIHVFYSHDEGYSTVLRSLEKMNVNGEADYDEVLKRASELDLLEYDGDYKQVDYVREIDYYEYLSFIGENKNIECFTCKQHHTPEEIQKTKGFRIDTVCKDCYKKEVKVYLTTDDKYFDSEEAMLSQEYLNWAIEENRGLIDMLIDGYYAPDSHTDCLLYDDNSPTIVKFKDYIETNNNFKPLGYSISVDPKSFEKWVEKNKFLLSDKGFLV